MPQRISSFINDNICSANMIQQMAVDIHLLFCLSVRYLTIWIKLRCYFFFFLYILISWLSFLQSQWGIKCDWRSWSYTSINLRKKWSKMCYIWWISNKAVSDYAYYATLAIQKYCLTVAKFFFPWLCAIKLIHQTSEISAVAYQQYAKPVSFKTDSVHD